MIPPLSAIALLALLSTSAKHVSASHSCSVKAIASCIMDDDRPEFLPFLGRPCNEFHTSHVIDVEKVHSKSYSGAITAIGYPLIKVKLSWQMCNTNNEQIEAVQMIPSKSYALYKSTRQPIRKRGVIQANTCREFESTYLLDSSVRNHKIETHMEGYLRIDDQIFDGIGGREIKCNDTEKDKVSLQYSDDCQLEASTACFLTDNNGDVTNIPCDETIEYTFPTCVDIPVRYKFTACNQETSRSIRLNKKKSKFNLNQVTLGKMGGVIQPETCLTKYHDDVMNSCDNASLIHYSLFLKGAGSDKDCHDKNFGKATIRNARPSSFPSSKPTTSVISSPVPPTLPPSQPPTLKPSPVPSTSPSMSKQPSQKPSSKLSSIPSHESLPPSPQPSIGPSSLLSLTPSSEPSSNPSEAPTLLPSITPSSLPSLLPTFIPSSSLPSLTPSLGPDCIVDYPQVIGNGHCDDLPPYNTVECGWDGGDCDLYNSLPNCTVNNPYYIGNGFCDDLLPYNTEECGWDGGDCERNPVDGYADCFVHHPLWIGNGFCSDYPPYDTEECGWDGGDCVP